MDFLLSFWGIFLIIHVIGLVVFQPYMVRSLQRGTSVTCPLGNSDEHCKRYHPVDCRFKYGVRKKIEEGELWGGTAMAMVWELTGLYMFFKMRAAKPDKVQQLYQQERDQVNLEQLTTAQRKIAAAKGINPLELKTSDGHTFSSGDEQTVYVPEPMSLRQVQAMMSKEIEKANDDYYYRTPDWVPNELLSERSQRNRQDY